MIGASLVGSSGIPNWGGGSNDCKNLPTSGIFALCPTIFAPRPLPYILLCLISIKIGLTQFYLLAGVHPNLLAWVSCPLSPSY